MDYRTNEENELLLNEIGLDIIEIKAKDSGRDSQTGTCLFNFTPKLRLCVVARVMVTANTNVLID